MDEIIVNFDPNKGVWVGMRANDVTTKPNSRHILPA